MTAAHAVYVIYRDPTDYPGHFVVRRQMVSVLCVTPDREPLAVTESLPSARAALPPGLARLSRDPLDEPQIVETWL